MSGVVRRQDTGVGESRVPPPYPSVRAPSAITRKPGCHCSQQLMHLTTIQSAQNSLQGPKTPQSLSSLTTPTSGESKFAGPSPVGMAPVSSQPQLVRQQSSSSTVPVSTTQTNACHISNTQGGYPLNLKPFSNAIY